MIPKATKNQLGTAENQYQGDTKRVLCVCAAGILRSPTIADVLHTEYAYNTRAVGIDPDYALIPISHALLVWADEIVCCSTAQKVKVKEMMVELGIKFDNETIKLICLTDEYDYGDSYLRLLIKERYNP